MCGQHSTKSCTGDPDKWTLPGFQDVFLEEVTLEQVTSSKGLRESALFWEEGAALCPGKPSDEAGEIGQDSFGKVPWLWDFVL